MATVRICVCGDDGVGKSSLITSLVKDVFVSGRIQPVLPQITLPPTLGTPDNCTTIIIDTSAQPQDREILRKQARKCNVILLAYSDHYSYERVALFWMPYFRSLGVNVPVILCANKSDLTNTGSTPQVVEEEMLPVMGEFKEIDSCIRTSAREHHNINEVFFLCQKAVTHPIAPLFDSKELTLKPATISALHRIFYLCDKDQDGLLNDEEIQAFQSKIFGKPLSSEDLAHVKSSVRQHEHNQSSSPAHEGIDRAEFIQLNYLFVEKGRHETLWMILRAFQYADSLTLKDSFLHPRFDVPQSSSAELSPAGYRFFVDLFLLFDKDNDGGLNGQELQSLFAPTPGLPKSWLESDFPSCTVSNESGHVTLQGWLAQWSMTTFEEPKTTLEYLAYLGFDTTEKGKTTAALKITKARKRRRRAGRVERSVFHCYILGASHCGKSSLLSAFLNRRFDATYHPTIRPRKAVNSVELPGGKQCYLILEELGEVESAVLENNAKIEACDILCFTYDSSDPDSFSHIVELRKKNPHLDELPSLYAALKADMDKTVQRNEVQPDQYTASLGMAAPLHVSVTWGSIPELFVHLAESATYPAQAFAKLDEEIIDRTPLYIALGATEPPRYVQNLQSRQFVDRRRGHNQQLPLNDNAHHVTEAIGGMYDEEGHERHRHPRPLSFAPSQLEEGLERKASQVSSSRLSPTDSPLSKSISSERSPKSPSTSPTPNRPRQTSISDSTNGPASPSLSRSPSASTANQAFPLNDIDYESSPAAVAQELSNLQAIRRMSMNVDAADPDLPSFASGFGVPPVAPSHSDGEDDTSRLFWVPARLHPELAPKDYKSFVEDRVDRIKRTSGDEDALSPDSMTRTSSGDSSKVNRRKSMLSKTIELPQDLKDGADVLDRKRSGHQRMTSAETSLQELEALVSDPSEMVRKMSLDATRRSLDSNAEVPVNEDMPILPTPAGQTLKRSTRTQYRRGSLRKGEVLGRRNTRRGKDAEVTEQAEEQTPPVPDLPPTLTDNPLSRIQSEPIKVLTQDTSLGDRPRSSRQIRAEQSLQETASLDDLRDERSQEPPNEGGHTHPQPRPFQSRIARNGRTTAQVPGMPTAAIPQIIETPPSDSRHSLPPSGLQQRPERKSSHDFARSNSMPTSRAPIRSALGKPKPQPNQSLDEMASHPSPMPGTNTNTDALSFIPTLPEERKSDKRAKASKESGDPGSKKTSWGWLLGSEEKEREKEKKREEKEEREQSKKQKTKIKAVEKSYDSTRLDVLQTAADGARGRESIVLERDSNSKLEEERRKESNRRSGGAEGKKDKEPGIFSSLFGGSKKKADRDSGGKRNPIMRGLSPDPPRKSLRADIDYNWTRFSILEERAIYRMAHIKLANPRRALQSQVLLSNFMYSYLAKVQQMHPQIQIPQYQQKSQKQQRQEPAQKESDEYSAWQRYQEQQDRSTGDSHGSDPSSANMVGVGSSTTHASYIDDYDPNHQQAEDARHAEHRQQSTNTNGHSGYDQYAQEQNWVERDPYTQQGLFDDDRPPEANDMW